MRTIAQCAGVFPANLYYYFPSKDAILAAIALGALRALEQATRETSPTVALPAAERLRIFVRRQIQTTVDHREAVEVFIHEQRYLEAPHREEVTGLRREIDRRLETILRAGIMAGEFQMDSARIAVLALEGMLNWTIEWYRSSGRLGPEDLADALYNIFFHGVERR